MFARGAVLPSPGFEPVSTISGWTNISSELCEIVFSFRASLVQSSAAAPRCREHSINNDSAVREHYLQRSLGVNPVLTGAPVHRRTQNTHPQGSPAPCRCLAPANEHYQYHIMHRSGRGGRRSCGTARSPSSSTQRQTTSGMDASPAGCSLRRLSVGRAFAQTPGETGRAMAISIRFWERGSLWLHRYNCGWTRIYV